MFHHHCVVFVFADFDPNIIFQSFFGGPGGGGGFPGFQQAGFPGGSFTFQFG